MKLGIFSNGKRWGKTAAEAYDEDLDEIVAADQLGYGKAWISEHIGINQPATLPTPELLIAKAAALTSQIRLGVAVRCLPLYHPIDVGKLEDVRFDDVADQGWFALGDPDRVYEGIKQLFDESGGFGTLLITMGRDWSTPEKRARSLRLFMAEVAPRLVDLKPR